MRHSSRNRRTHPSTPAPASIAEAVAQKAVQAFNGRADVHQNDLDNHNTNHAELDRRCIAVLRGGAAWAINDRTVCATVPDTRDGRLWHSYAADALDRASQDLPDTAEIAKTGRVTYILTW